MQELMCRHKVYGLSPRDCLKTTLFQKWQRIVAPPGESVSCIAFVKLQNLFTDSSTFWLPPLLPSLEQFLFAARLEKRTVKLCIECQVA